MSEFISRISRIVYSEDCWIKLCTVGAGSLSSLMVLSVYFCMKMQNLHLRGTFLSGSHCCVEICCCKYCTLSISASVCLLDCKIGSKLLKIDPQLTTENLIYYIKRMKNFTGELSISQLQSNIMHIG